MSMEINVRENLKGNQE